MICDTRILTSDIIIHDKDRDKKGTTREKLQRTWRYRNRHFQTGMVKEIQVQIGTYMGRQGQKGTDRDRQEQTGI